jgi:hypothetical protein
MEENTRYDHDLDYIPWIYFDNIELMKIIEKADGIITGNNENNEILAMAYLKKAQCLLKLDEIYEHSGIKKQFIDKLKKNCRYARAN